MRLFITFVLVAGISGCVTPSEPMDEPCEASIALVAPASPMSPNSIGSKMLIRADINAAVDTWAEIDGLRLSDFDDGETLMPTWGVADPGTTTVDLVAEGVDGCIAHDTLVIVIDETT